MNAGDVVGGVVVAVAAGAVVAALRIIHKLILRSAIRGLVGALDKHTEEKLDPRFDKIEARLDDQDRALDLQSQELLRIAGRSNITPFRRVGDGRG